MLWLERLLDQLKQQWHAEQPDPLEDELCAAEFDEWNYRLASLL